jgi:pyridoxamine 5'-phosphate oxidase family protein
MFDEREVKYIQSQRLARISTVDEDCQPDVVPVGFDFDGENFYIGGRRNKKLATIRISRARTTGLPW